jgi:hypothetical protein
MKNPLIAALLISAALVASPAFAGNSASNAPFTTFPGVGSKTRAEVKSELVAAVQDKSVAPEGNRVDPADSAISRQEPSAHRTALAQANSQVSQVRQ